MVIADYTGVAAGSLTDLVFVHAARAGAPSPRGRESSYLWLRLRWRRQWLRSRLACGCAGDVESETAAAGPAAR